MNKTLIIYDNEGYILSKITGFYRIPVGIPYLEVEVPSDKFIVSVDIETLEPIYEDIPPNEIEVMQSKIDILEAENADLKKVTKEQDDLLVDNAFKIAEIQMNMGGM